MDPSLDLEHLSTGSLDLEHLPTEKPYVRIHCFSDANYFLSVRDGKLILAAFNMYDESQHWYKEEKFNTGVDTSGFSLVNKATGQAIQYTGDKSNTPVLITYNPEVLDKSVLWTLSLTHYYTYELCGAQGYGYLSPANDTSLYLDAEIPCTHRERMYARDGGLVQINEMMNYKYMESKLWKIIHDGYV